MPSKPRIENAVEICVGASEQDRLPLRAPILHAVRVFRLEPFRPVGQPAVLPVIAVVLRLADAEICEKQAPAAIRLGAHEIKDSGGLPRNQVESTLQARFNSGAPQPSGIGIKVQPGYAADCRRGGMMMDSEP
jgi:hypothetical protein